MNEKFSYLAAYTCRNANGSYSFYTRTFDSRLTGARNGAAMDVAVIALFDVLSALKPNQIVVGIQISAIVADPETDSFNRLDGSG